MTAPQPIDSLIEPRWIIPIEPADVTLTGHALAVDKGRILAILPAAEALARFAPRQRISLPEHVLLPGLVNLHTHAAMTLLRGFADDMPLMRWLNEHIWPAEARHVSPAFVRDGTLLACWEMLRGGITCFNDMYFYPEAAAEAVLDAGIRAALGITVIEFPTAYAADAADYLAKGLATRDALRDDPLLSFCLAPHAPYTVSDKTFERIATLANQLDLPVHIHIHETRAEIEDSLRQHGVRPLARLQRTGLLGPGLIGVHGVHLDAGRNRSARRAWLPPGTLPDLQHETRQRHCPHSLAQAQGVGVGLGSDGAASNNRLDLFHEMRHAALLAKAPAKMPRDPCQRHDPAHGDPGRRHRPRPGIRNRLAASGQERRPLRRPPRRLDDAALLRPGFASGLCRRARACQPYLGGRAIHGFARVSRSIATHDI